MTSVNRSGQYINNVRYPTDNDDAASKQYVDLAAAGGLPTEFAFDATLDVDVSASATFEMSDDMTANMAITLLNGEDGDSGVILVSQNGAGGWKITGITAAGRTILMRDDLTTINTAAMLVASAKSLIAYQYATVSGDAVVIVSIVSAITAAYT